MYYMLIPLHFPFFQSAPVSPRIHANSLYPEVVFVLVQYMVFYSSNHDINNYNLTTVTRSPKVNGEFTLYSARKGAIGVTTIGPSKR